jgi:D-alanine-D-alanine ligase
MSRQRLRVAVLQGGRSSERDAAYDSAGPLLDALAANGHDAIPIDVELDGRWRRNGGPMRLETGGGLIGADVAFPLLHGPFGEDGTVQGLLEWLDVPYVGAGVLASALCLDKLRFKALLGYAGLPQADYRSVTEERFDADPAAVLSELGALGLPAFVKPSQLGSSFGVSRVEHEAELTSALEVAFEYGSAAIVEAAVTGREIECGVVGDRDLLVSPPGELRVVRSKSGWRDQATKARRGSIHVLVPAHIPPAASERIRQLAHEVFRLTDCAGLARIDFLCDGERVLVNELNTMPGVRPTSVFSLVMEAAGLPYAEMLDRLLELALERHARRARYRL